MKHKIFINDQGIIEMKYIGPISEEENIEMIKKSYDFITQKIDKGEKPLVLVDMADSTDFRLNSINIQAMRDSEAIKLAGYGITKTKDRETAQRVIDQAGASKKAKMFDSRQEAINWLLTE